MVYLFKDLAKRIKMLFLTVTSQALIIPIFDLLAVDLELNSLAFMWVVAFKKKKPFSTCRLENVFFPYMNSLGGERKESTSYSLFVFLGS